MAKSFIDVVRVNFRRAARHSRRRAANCSFH